MTIEVPRGTTRLLAVALLALVAAGGIGVGVAVDRLALRPHRSSGERRFGGPPPYGRRGGPPPEGAEFGGGLAPRGGAMRDRFARELDLSPAQRLRVDSIMGQQAADFRRLRGEMQPRFDSLLSRAQLRLDSVLTPAQRDQLKRLREREFFGRR